MIKNQFKLKIQKLFNKKNDYSNYFKDIMA